MHKYCEKDKYNFFTLVAPISGSNDTSSHYIGYVKYNKIIYFLDPAYNDQWGLDIEEWVGRLKNIWEKDYKFKIEEYNPDKKPQSYEFDTFCQTWSLFLQYQFIEKKWGMKKTQYNFFDDLIPFIIKKFNPIMNFKYEDVKNIIELEDPKIKVDEKVYDQSYVYYTLKSGLTIPDFCEAMLTERNLSNTTYYIIPALGYSIELDDNELTFLKKHKLVSSKIFTILEKLQIEQTEYQKKLKAEEANEAEEAEESKETISRGGNIEATYYIYNTVCSLIHFVLS